MKKFVQLLVVLSMIALVFLASSPAMADPPDEALGDWSYFVYDIDVKVAGSNMFMTTYDHGYWTGTFEGESTEVGMVVGDADVLVDEDVDAHVAKGLDELGAVVVAEDGEDAVAGADLGDDNAHAFDDVGVFAVVFEPRVAGDHAQVGGDGR